MGAASQMLKDIFSGAESSMESVATKTIPNALQRGTIEAFRQGEQNKKANKPLIDAMNNVAAKTEEVNTTIEDKLNFQPVG
jgi:flagellar biosynthesis/type III secretory pathway protein FliH